NFNGASKTRHSETPKAGSESVNAHDLKSALNAKDTLCIGALLHRRQIFDWKHHALVLISYVKNLRNRRSLLLPLRGFTLAEVLITLGIIGVVAALTIPTLMQKTDERETVSKLKKFYSEISQAYSLAKTEHGTPDNWYNGVEYNVGDIDASNIMGDIITDKLKVQKACHGAANTGCFPNVSYKRIDGGSSGNYETNNDFVSKYLLADGTSLFFYTYGSTPQNSGNGMAEKLYGAMGVDINGEKGPNTAGIDNFSFIISERGIIPAGSQILNPEANSAFPNDCNVNSCSGGCEACAAWVIYSDNMDYLKCSDLSWNGKTKCD
ncbi:type II secretion system protein, partial [bacterium]|nr:type II secretion system protein [bacterium]